MVQPHIVPTTAEAGYIALSSASHEVIAVMNCQGFVLTVSVKQKIHVKGIIWSIRPNDDVALNVVKQCAKT